MRHDYALEWWPVIGSFRIPAKRLHGMSRWELCRVFATAAIYSYEGQQASRFLRMDSITAPLTVWVYVLAAVKCIPTRMLRHGVIRELRGEGMLT